MKKTDDTTTAKIREAYLQGKSDAQIADYARCGVSAVKSWRYKNGFKSNYKQGQKMQKPLPVEFRPNVNSAVIVRVDKEEVERLCKDMGLGEPKFTLAERHIAKRGNYILSEAAM